MEISDSPSTSQGSDSGKEDNDDKGENGEESEKDEDGDGDVSNEDGAIEDGEEGGNCEEDDNDDDDEGRDVDDDNNIIPEVTRSWFIGSQCHENAEIAHSLIHWYDISLFLFFVFHIPTYHLFYLSRIAWSLSSPPCNSLLS